MLDRTGPQAANQPPNVQTKGTPNVPDQASQTVIDKLTRWYKLKAQVSELSAQESALRQEIFGDAFPDAGEKGSYRVGVGGGKDLKGTSKLNYSVDREKYAELRDSLPVEVQGRVFRLKPEVVEAELLRVEDKKVKAKLAEIITSKPGLPSLEIVDVKKRG